MLKYLNYLTRIWDPGWKKVGSGIWDPGSGIIIPDPQHWFNGFILHNATKCV
jgi:hypothetical protein